MRSALVQQIKNLSETKASQLFDHYNLLRHNGKGSRNRDSELSSQAWLGLCFEAHPDFIKRYNKGESVAKGYIAISQTYQFKTSDFLDSLTGGGEMPTINLEDAQKELEELFKGDHHVSNSFSYRLCLDHLSQFKGKDLAVCMITCLIWESKPARWLILGKASKDSVSTGPKVLVERILKYLPQHSEETTGKQSQWDQLTKDEQKNRIEKLGEFAKINVSMIRKIAYMTLDYFPELPQCVEWRQKYNSPSPMDIVLPAALHENATQSEAIFHEHMSQYQSELELRTAVVNNDNCRIYMESQLKK